jgi:hypothetical protein
MLLTLLAGNAFTAASRQRIGASVLLIGSAPMQKGLAVSQPRIGSKIL